jgi:hypothetical protein
MAADHHHDQHERQEPVEGRKHALRALRGRGSGQPPPCEARGQGRRAQQEAAKIDSERLGVEAAEPVRSAIDSRYISTANLTGPKSSICYPIRTAAPTGPPTAARSLPPHVPNGRITTALVDPDGSGFVTEAIPDPTLHAWWGSVDQYPVA